MTREEEMIKEHECAMNERIPENIRGLMVSAMKWADYHSINQWHKAENELPPRKSEDSHQSLVVIVSDGFDFEKAYYNYFYSTWVGNNITPTYWMRLLKPEE